ncbi:uncharacterized protein JCM10292_002722 [Rhodotorula paludigena]|uniref:uncharacterized protein n=1 Tax=Rhodotorula paludigena TaxID=86838 RepID=UPI00317C2B6C
MAVKRTRLLKGAQDRLASRLDPCKKENFETRGENYMLEQRAERLALVPNANGARPQRDSTYSVKKLEEPANFYNLDASGNKPALVERMGDYLTGRELVIDMDEEWGEDDVNAASFEWEDLANAEGVEEGGAIGGAAAGAGGIVAHVAGDGAGGAAA